MSDENPMQSEDPADLVEALRTHLPMLQDVEIESTDKLPGSVAEALAILVGLLQRFDQTILTQLEFLGKNHSRIRTMSETLRSQGLLDVQSALENALGSNPPRMHRLVNYCDLLLRWWSAVLAGVQSTLLELPHELENRLNPANWEVEKKRWSAEEVAFWAHYQYAIRPELPLEVSDRLKEIQAEKTLDAYAIIGSGRHAPQDAQGGTHG